MTDQHINTLPIRCYECLAISRLLSRIDDNTADFVCANGHIWRDDAPIVLCVRCGQTRETHVELSGDGFGPLLMCARTIRENIFHRA